MPVITIDGRPIEVEPGALIIQAADRLGVEIPRFCYHPDLCPEGNCRMCLVQVKGFARPVVACATPVADGMVVETVHRDEGTRQAVNGVLEFLLVNHPLDCPICDQSGECSLQDFYMHPDYGLHSSQVDPVEKVRKRKAIPLGPMVVLDSERCVMCSRCVRFSRDVSGYGELQFVNRGNRVELKAFEDRTLEDPYAGNLVDVCPVGALTSRDFRFKRRVWYLASTPSICPGCSTGCNVRVDHYQGRIERVVPRRNPGVNRSWICDEGRMGWQRLGRRPRMLAPSLWRDGARSETSWEEALDACVGALHRTAQAGEDGPRSAMLASCDATNEALWLLRRLARYVGRGTMVDARTGDEDRLVNEREDALLRRRDKHANTRGAMLLGLTAGGGLAEMADLARQGQVGLSVILYYQPTVGEEPAVRLDLLRDLVERSEASIVLTSHAADWWERATVALPVAAWGEEEGTYTNFAGVAQHCAAAVVPPGGARPAVEVLADLLAAVGQLGAARTPERIFEEIAAEVPAYRDQAYATLVSRMADAYPPEGRMPYGREGFAGR